MKNAAQMFKFTQLRPVNGIEIHKIRKKHIPLYKKDYTTKLLSSVQKLGLPNGLTILNKHIQTSEFNDRIIEFDKLSSFEESKELPQLSMLTLVLQKAISFSQTFSTLNDEKNKNLEEILEETRAIKKKFNINLAKLNTEISALTQKDKDNIVDDCYALLLQSAFYPEYRRYIETLHRFKYLSDIYEVKTIYNVLFQKEKGTSLTLDEFDILRQFFSGRILLPKNVETSVKPLPSFEVEDSDNEKDSRNYIEVFEEKTDQSILANKTEHIKGIGFTIQKLKQDSGKNTKERLFKLRKNPTKK